MRYLALLLFWFSAFAAEPPTIDPNVICRSSGATIRFFAKDGLITAGLNPGDGHGERFYSVAPGSTDLIACFPNFGAPWPISVKVAPKAS